MGVLSKRSRSTRNSSSANTSLGISLLRQIPIVRWIGPSVTMMGIAAIAYYALSGRIDFSKLDGISETLTGVSGDTVIQPVSLESLGRKSPETIRIATFNIQVFGEKKSADENVMRVLAQIVTQFDVVAIQEVKGGDGKPVLLLTDLIKRSGGNYGSVVSRPIGRTSQTESYAFVWDQSRIMFVPDSAYLVQDGEVGSDNDRMHREPMVASFQVRPMSADGRIPFSFNIINAHTDPDEVSASAGINELDVLDDVFVRVRQYEYDTTGEEDCLLVGDLNVDTRNLNELGQIPNVVSIAGDILTNTRQTKTYDHILLDRTVTTEFTGRFGVVHFERDLGLTAEQAVLVSDHLPVWAEFSAFESPRPSAMATANGPVTPRR